AYLSKEFIQENSKFNFLLVQDVVYTAYTEAFNKYLTELKKFHCVSVRDESVMNNYSLTAIAKAIKEGRKKVFFEVLQKSSGYAELLRSGKNSFSKSLFDILAENDLLNSKVIFSNPIHMQKSELDYLSGKNVNVVLCPSDILKLADRKPENYDFLKYGLNVSIGTGYTGKSVLSELKLFSHLAKKGSISYLALLKMAIVNPSITFNVSETHGSIEKNKIANLVLFDINDLRNYFIHPEATSEKVAEHILENFDSKDISDVIIKGNIIRRDHRSKLFDADTMRQNTLELAGKIFETGKYYEFKEKYLMRKRIKELSINNKEEKEMIVNAAESAVDESVYQDTAIISDSEFRIIGIQKNINDINTEGTQGIRQNEAFSVFELESLDKGFNLFNEPIELTHSLKKSSEKTVVEKSSAKPNVVFRRISADQSDEEDKSELQPKKSSEAQLPTEKKTPLKKSNLRFGFSDEE
ncbi:MAG: amidohydrolase family protein, partial [Ignavibacteriae bacterium]|nr:amidohydrolase family protein [Ignavibacteriota bacterium]